MVSGKFRSRTYARTRRKTPSGENVLRHSLRKPAKATCGRCEKPLHGVARGRPAAVRKMAKSERVPNRPFAGSLCSSCSRKELVARTRS